MTPSLASPDVYLHSFEDSEGILVPMDRAAYRRSIFLDARISPAHEGYERMPLAQLAQQAPPPLSVRWIFHIAHCGSTLLARALEALDGTLVLREPLALRQLALAPDRSLLPAVLALLGRRYDAGHPTLIKANVPVNFILPEIAAVDPKARVIFLTMGLHDYLAAVLRSEGHRKWVRGVTAQLAENLPALGRAGDAERAAALWLAQQRRFAAACRAMPNARALDAERFFADPAATLAAAAKHLGIAADETRIAATVAGPLFAVNAKRPSAAFTNADRLARKAALASELAADYAAAESSIGDHAPAVAALLEELAGRILA
jgi:hypothetical protein